MLRLPRAWPYALVPIVVFVVLEMAVVYLSLRFVKPQLDVWLAVGDDWAASLGWLGDALRWLVQNLAPVGSWLGTLAAAALGWIVSLMLAPPVSAPALERIVGIVEDDLRQPARAELSFLAELWCGLRSTLLSLSITVPLILALTLLELLVPPAAVVAMPLKLLIGALGVAWSLFDYPLTLRGVRARDRIALLRRHATVVLGFGAAFAVFALSGCCSVVMLPVGVAAATQLLAEMQRARER